jgi:uncharacterized membrane protein
MYYLNYFFIFSIIGYIIETLLFPNDNSGILFGWWTPVYGFGVIIIIIINNIINKYKLNKLTKIIILAVSCAIILSILEAIGGYLINWLFDTSLWDYTNQKFNIGKYASLEMATIWGLSSIIVIYVLKPITDKIITKIPKYITKILMILFIIDIITTIFLKAHK